MRLRRRPEPDPAPEPANDPALELAQEPVDEPANDPVDAVAAPEAGAPLAEAPTDEIPQVPADQPALGEDVAVPPDPTAAIPDDRIGEAHEPLHDPAPAGPHTLTPTAAALAAEACSKSGVVWVRPAGESRHRMAWHVWHADAVHIVTGVGEQLLPPLAGEVEIVARSKDDGSRLITFVAQGQEVLPSSADWAPAVDALIASRLNAPDQEESRARWASAATVYRLVPVAYESLGAGDDSTDVGAVRPPRIAATTVGAQPWHLGGRKRRIRGIWKRDGRGDLVATDGERR